MAEDEERRDGSKRSQRRDPARSARRDPQVVEGQAQDVTPIVDPMSAPVSVPDPVPEATSPLSGEQVTTVEAQAADPISEPAFAAREAAAGSTTSYETPLGAHSEQAGDALRRDSLYDPDSRDPRSRWGILAAAGFVVLAAAVLYLFYQLSSVPPDTSGAVADLKARLASLESRPATDAAGLGDRLTRVEREIGALQTQLDATGKQMTQVGDAVAAQPNFGGTIKDLQAAVATLKSDLSGVTASIAALPRPDVGRIETRIGDIDQKVSTLQGAVSGIPHVDLGPLTGKVDALEARLSPIESDVSAARSPEQVAQRRAAPVAVTAQAISEAIVAGQAFPRELQALQALGTDPAKLAPLKAVADIGAPSLADLQASLAASRDQVLAEGATPASGSYMDRLVAGASSLVQVRPLGSVIGDTPSAVLARMNDDIGRDDLAAALAEWHKLPEPSQNKSRAVADRIKLRLDAEQAAKEIAANAIGAMALPRG